jgi:uncharacterized protein YdcH (DUF465 family)
MSFTPRDIREQLLSGDAEFQKLAQEHSFYEMQLQQLSRSPYLNSDVIEQEANLKKLKLRVKDEMERRIARVSISSQVH